MVAYLETADKRFKQMLT
uniref:Uncharacterized protein n=1 Tax=Anguilla anguilla TaxID=7936 RepID=A0A0E9TW30_ANGAN